MFCLFCAVIKYYETVDLPHWYTEGFTHCRDLGLDGEGRVLLVMEHGSFQGEEGDAAPQPHKLGGGGAKQIWVFKFPAEYKYRAATDDEHKS
jgi:hypothetical protein